MIRASTVCLPGTAVSRETHRAASVFYLQLSLAFASPTMERRLGLARTIVFQFHKPVVGGATGGCNCRANGGSRKRSLLVVSSTKACS